MKNPIYRRIVLNRPMRAGAVALFFLWHRWPRLHLHKLISLEPGRLSTTKNSLNAFQDRNWLTI